MFQMVCTDAHKYLCRVPYDNFMQRYGLITSTRLLAQGSKDDISFLFLNFLLSALSLYNLFLSFTFFAVLCLFYPPFHPIGKANNYFFYLEWDEP